MPEIMRGAHNFPLERVQTFNWLILLILTLAAGVLSSVHIAFSLMIGGIIANLSFIFLKKDLARLLTGPLYAAKARFFIKYYARLSLVVLVLFLLVYYRQVNVIALLIGLSTVLLSIIMTVVGEAKKVFLNVKEAS